MGNCLITKLKEAVNNDMLLKLNEGRILVRAIDPSLLTDDRQRWIGIKITAPTVVSVTKNGYFSTSSDLSNPLTSATITPEMYTYIMYVPNDNFEILISNKYNIEIIMNSSDAYTNGEHSLFTVNLSDISYTENMKTLSVKKATGNLSDIDKNNLTSLNLSYTNVTGDISVLASMTDLQTIGLRGTGVSGDIAILTSLVNLISLEIDSEGVYGNLDTVLDAFAASGRTTELSLIINPAKVNLTGSTPEVFEYTVHFSGNSWSLA